MKRSLNTAIALLEAKNFDGARRLVNELLEEAPDDISCWILRIRIESTKENYKEALRICRDVLRQHPENADLRNLEFETLGCLRRKRDAKKTFEKFKTDFPNDHVRIRDMQLCLDALHGKTWKFIQYMESLGGDEDGPEVKRDLGLLYHKTLDFFRAQRYMTDASAFYPDDLELNKALAQNSLQLGKLALARNYARNALRLSPGDRHMRTLILISYLFYLPQFYVFNILFLIAQMAYCYFGLIISFVILFLLFGTAIDLVIFFERVAGIFVGRETDVSFVLYFVYLFIFLLVQYPDYWKFLYERKSTVKMKKY